MKKILGSSILLFALSSSFAHATWCQSAFSGDSFNDSCECKESPADAMKDLDKHYVKYTTKDERDSKGSVTTVYLNIPSKNVTFIYTRDKSSCLAKIKPYSDKSKKEAEAKNKKHTDYQ